MCKCEHIRVRMGLDWLALDERPRCDFEWDGDFGPFLIRAAVRS